VSTAKIYTAGAADLERLRWILIRRMTRNALRTRQVTTEGDIATGVD
jgi:hypothetical protein